MNWIELAFELFEEAVGRKEYLDYANGNPYAEADVEHFKDIGRLVTDLWKEKYHSECPPALVIAAKYHDFDRVFPPSHSNDPTIRTKRRTIDTKNIPDSTYTEDEVKKILHPQNCAAIFLDYNPDLPLELRNDVCYLIERHEVGAEMGTDGFVEKQDEFTGSYNLNQAADVLCEADGLGFFSLTIYSYVKGRTEERVRQKIIFSYEKLSPEGKGMARAMQYHNVEYEGKTIDVNALVKSTI